MTIYVIDGSALLQAQVALLSTFGELADSIFDQLPKVQRVDFVSDSYLPLSIKGIERARGCSSEAFLIIGTLTKVPRDWKKFLSNDKNKQRFIHFLLDEWKKDKYGSKLLGKKVLFVCENKYISLSNSDGTHTVSEEVEELISTQEEADTKIILHCVHIAFNPTDESTIIVRYPDTDVVILLLNFIQGFKQKVLFDTGTGNKRHLIHIHSIIKEVEKDLCLALSAVHAFTGCDTTSAFVRKGKVIALNILKQHQDFVEIFQRLGKSVEIDDDVFDKLERFTCLLYGDAGTLTNYDMRIFYKDFVPNPGCCYRATVE
ncbi:uncharacterized protein LOC121386637 [Gigantopelta aegis]|uniref:uncharacterized protein LOC121386637 n=1 Tax=Gigantopelta aegis TaxID=1735272 RepID=UPI001B88E71D|nr:uncharacterized protein LOC121386637 [Gigantopelta aegis]